MRKGQTTQCNEIKGKKNDQIIMKKGVQSTQYTIKEKLTKYNEKRDPIRKRVRVDLTKIAF